MRPDSGKYYCYLWCGRMRWACVRDETGIDCNWVLAHSSGRIVPGRVGSWDKYQQRDRASIVRDIFGDLKLEGLDAAQMKDLGAVTDEILAVQMEILAENEVYDSRENTVGEDSEDGESFSGKRTYNPAAP
jgi:hypothetical protein